MVCTKLYCADKSCDTFNRSNMKPSILKIYVATVILVALPFSCKSADHGDNNIFLIGVSFTISEHGVPHLASARLWTRLHVNRSHPDPVNKFRPLEKHHGYLGLLLIGSGHILNARSVRLAGEILLFDDLIQHTLRVQTPIHVLNDYLWRHEWYRRIQR